MCTYHSVSHAGSTNSDPRDDTSHEKLQRKTSTVHTHLSTSQKTKATRARNARRRTARWTLFRIFTITGPFLFGRRPTR